MKAYLAGPWFSEKANIIENYANTISSLCKNKYEVFRPREHSTNNPYETYLGNIKAIYECDLLVALITEKDVGTAFEIGYARALGKDIILVGFSESDFERKTNLMLAFAGDQCITIDKLHKLFEGTIDYEKDTVKEIKNSWSNIE